MALSVVVGYGYLYRKMIESFAVCSFLFIFANINRLVSEECRKRGNETIARRREISFFPDSWP